MKYIALVLLVATFAHAASDTRLFAWQESRDNKTGQRQYGFFLAPAAVKEVFEAGAKGDVKKADALQRTLPPDAWLYGVLLRGDTKVYPKETIMVFEPSPCGSKLPVADGSIEVDRKAKTVRVALKVNQGAKPTDFVGNGVYQIQK